MTLVDKPRNEPISMIAPWGGKLRIACSNARILPCRGVSHPPTTVQSQLMYSSEVTILSLFTNSAGRICLNASNKWAEADGLLGFLDYSYQQGAEANRLIA